MRQGTFRINDTDSHEINSFIQFLPEISTPKRKVQRRNISGVSEDYIFDEEAYENTPINLELFAKAPTKDHVQQLKDEITLTFMGGRYLEFVPYWDNERIYEVEVVEPPTFLPNSNHPTTVFYTVGLSAKPFKVDGIKLELESASEISLINPYGYDNRPLITLYGTGDMNLIVNGKKYVFQSIDDHVVVDSHIESAYKLIANTPQSRNNRMYTDNFPILKPGENKISITGNATEFKIETRWKTLVS